MADKNHTKQKDVPMPLWKGILFRLIAISFPILLILMVEVILRIAGVGEKLDLFLENPAEGYEEYMFVNPVVGKKYFRKFEHTSPPNDIFLKDKPEGCFRMFVMGSSTVAGFPHDNNVMFSRILHQRLKDAYPDRYIEMVNTAITAVNSHTLRDFAPQILAQEPDAVLIYAGHNEFYGANGVGSNERARRSSALTRLGYRLMDLRFYQLLSGIGSGKKDPELKGTLMKRMVASPDIPLDGKAYEVAMARYLENMDAILREFSHAGIPVIISEVVSNVKDLKPFSAISGGKEDEAWAFFREGRQAYARGDYALAKENLYQAKALDGVRFRATEEVNEIIREIQDKYGCLLVPMLAAFEEESPHGIIGKELMTEHVHPNKRGNFVMADAFYQKVVESDLLGEPDPLAYTSEYYMRNWGYTPLDSLMVYHRIANLMTHWPFRPPDAPLEDYRRTYKPVSVPDSLAFLSMVDPNRNLTDIRLVQARYYEKSRRADLAYAEYEAILRTNPYLAVNFRDAAGSLLRLADIPLAEKYFLQSLQYEESFFARYRLGEIYMIKGDYGKARSTFQEAFEVSGTDEDRLKTLGKLYQSCVYAGETEDAKAIAVQLKQYQAEKYLRIPPPKYSYRMYIPYKTRPQVIRAQELMKENRYEDAARILEASLEVYDSHMAHRSLGECYLILEDPVKARLHLEKVKNEFAFDPEFPNVDKLSAGGNNL